MSLTRISGIILRQYYLIRDNPTRLSQLFVWSLLEITLWGFISVYVADATDARFALIFLGGIILWEFLIRVMYGVTITFFEDVWSRNFLNIFASPLSLSEYVVGMISASILTSSVSFVAIIIFASFVFGFSATIYGIAAFPFFLILFLSGIALGLIGVAIVLRFGPSAEWFIWPLPAIIAPFAGVFYPVSVLPLWMQTVSVVLPTTYVFEGFRIILAGGGVAIMNLIPGIALACLYCVLAFIVLYRVYRRAIRTGLIARYSAETVS